MKERFRRQIEFFQKVGRSRQDFQAADPITSTAALDFIANADENFIFRWQMQLDAGTESDKSIPLARRHIVIFVNVAQNSTRDHSGDLNAGHLLIIPSANHKHVSFIFV